MLRRAFCKLLLVAIVVFSLLTLCSAVMAQGRSDEGLERAIAAQEKHNEVLLAKAGVQGTGVGLDASDRHVIKVFTDTPGVGGVPRQLEGVPVEVVVAGKFVARVLPTARFPRPVPIGVSTGHPRITAGTIGCRVTDGTNVYALSNNHVYANENKASIGDNVLQPGPSDGGSNPADAIGTLHDFEPIQYARGRVPPTNIIDAAIALSSTSLLGTATPATPDSYGTPSSTTTPAVPGLQVQKYGRTTAWTTGTVDSVNATVWVRYDRGTVLFVEQIMITPGDFSAGGDSGSLIVTYNPDNSNEKSPVGLLFAGSDTLTIANPIDAVLDRFGVTIDDTPQGPVDNPPTVDLTNPLDGATVSGSISVAADASDDVGVTQVEFFVDGISISVDTTAPYEVPSWNSASVADGPHIIEAVATDTIGQTATDSVSVTVDNVDDPPNVYITNPENGAKVSGTVTVTADASDDKGVDQVEFFVDGASIGADMTAPYEVPSWNSASVADGPHIIEAVATDTIGKTASDSVSVTVDNSGPATMHVGDLDGYSEKRSKGNWEAIVTITVHNSAHTPVAGVVVNAQWNNNGSTWTDSGETDSNGKCTLLSGILPRNRTIATLTVTDMLDYEPGENHDPDGDSDGTTITVSK